MRQLMDDVERAGRRAGSLDGSRARSRLSLHEVAELGLFAKLADAILPATILQNQLLVTDSRHPLGPDRRHSTNRTTNNTPHDTRYHTILAQRSSHTQRSQACQPYTHAPTLHLPIMHIRTACA